MEMQNFELAEALEALENSEADRAALFSYECEPWNKNREGDIEAARTRYQMPEHFGIKELLDANQYLVQAIEGDAGAARPLRYEPHKRGRNWVALLTGKNAANMERHFLRYQNRMWDYSDFTFGDVLEFGADYYTCSGTPNRDRTYIVVLEASDDRLVFKLEDTAAKAMKLGRLLKAAMKRIEK